jgi:serine/threonine-protein kinase
MSPEQARGDRNLDHRVDIYACGVMLYECLTGRRPFHAANYNALLMQILTTSPRPTTEVRPAVPDAFEAIVAKAMQRDRDKRYQGASEMQRDVQMLRDPAGQMRRHQSVPPEPVPLVTHRRREDAPPSRPRPVELPPVSIDIEGRDLLDSGLNNESDMGDSGSIEIPIVAEAPVSAKDIAPPVSRPVSKPMYRPDPAFVAKHPPPPAQERRSIPPPIPAKPSGLKANVPAPPKVQPRTNVQQPPPVAKNRPRIPTPSALDAPWLDEQHDPDPTEIGSIYNLRSSHDAPIDADSTERIPPERLARIQAKRGQAPSADRTERVVTDKFQTQQIVEHLIAERVSDDEAPTTLFDRRALKGKLGRRGNTGGNPAAVPRTSTTERSPAPTPSAGRAPSVAPLAPPPLPRFRGPKDS